MKRILILLLLCVTAGMAQQAAPPRAAAPAIPPGFENKVEAYIRRLYAWGPAFTVKVGKLAESDVPGFYRVAIEVGAQGEIDTATMYISKDGAHLIPGDVLDTRVDPYAANRRALTTAGRPGRGPAAARVVVVDFSDFQCPHCRQLDEVMRQIVPQYPQVRFVSKHFPLEQLHPWAMTAHTAAECAYRLKPDAYWKFHDGVFDQQEAINVENAWQRMLDIGAAAGIEQGQLRTCMASPEAKQAIAADVKEG